MACNLLQATHQIIKTRSALVRTIASRLIIAAALLGPAGAVAAPVPDVLVTFAGTISNSNPGPLDAGVPYSGSFRIDGTVMPSGTSIIDWNNAVRDLVFTSGDNVFTGDGGRYRQFNNQFITGAFNVAGATLEGSVDVAGFAEPFLLTNISWDWRTSFPDNDVLVSGKTRDDFGFARLVLDFSNPEASVIERSAILGVQELNFTVVPLPGAIWLFLSAIGGLAVARRYTSR